MMKWLDGNGTNLGLIAAGILLICWNHGMVDDKIATTIAAMITSWTGVRIRHAYSKANPPNKASRPDATIRSDG